MKSAAGALTLSNSVRVNSWAANNTGAVTLGTGVTLGIDSGGLLFSANGAFTAGVVDLASYTQASCIWRAAATSPPPSAAFWPGIPACSTTAPAAAPRFSRWVETTLSPVD
ncbi:hypothetical protein [Verrucomicrobium spinosum]|uniref:hypothetical protein n=1 Tax=Verrucomicrobium spinosum TaxID=2736 RepID=UPI00155D9A37|nr:hypothetical protein [Verrucomicrobium spinosum]